MSRAGFNWLQSTGVGAEAIERERYGRPYEVRPRLGQGSFRIAVLDAYGGACAVTGKHSMPALEAAHIRPYSVGGAHELPNGLPLRRDIHSLFELGYVTATPTGQFLVSPRLREEFANGATYYALEGQKLREPDRLEAKPDRELLVWHSKQSFELLSRDGTRSAAATDMAGAAHTRLSETLRPKVVRLSAEKWRRGESNPRPRSHRAERLQA